MKDCNWMMCTSSCGFAAAGSIGLWLGEYVLGVTAILTALVSINFWRKEVEGPRHTADVAMASISFIIFTTHGALYVRDIHLLTYGWPCWVCLVVCFLLSRKLQKRPKHDRTWQIPHIIFHAMVSVGQALVVFGVHDTRLRIHGG